MNENNKIIYFSSTIMLFIYILSLTPGLSSEFANLFSNYVINFLVLISILIFSRINNKITLLLIIAYCGTFVYLRSSINIETIKNIYEDL